MNYVIDNLVENGWRYITSQHSTKTKELFWILGKSESFMRLHYDPCTDTVKKACVVPHRPNRELFLSTPIIIGINPN